MTRKIVLTVLLSVFPLALTVPSFAAQRWFQPIAQLPKPVFRHFGCILWHESRSTYSHPNLKDVSAYGSTGLFQVEGILWDRWAWVAGVGRKTGSWYLGTSSNAAVTIPAYKATPYQQAEVIATIWKYDKFGPWTDKC